MEQRDREKLIEIILKRGVAGMETFNYDKQGREKFLKLYGLTALAEEYDRLEQDFVFSENLEDSRKVKEKMHSVQEQIETLCREILEKEGVDVEKLVGKRQTPEEEKQQLLEQLGQMGITPEMAKGLGLDDMEALKTSGKEFRFEKEDTKENREALKKYGIAFTPTGNGKLVINGRVEVKEGLAYDDTPENRRILDENEIKYIRFAQGKAIGDNFAQKLFVPVNWRNALFPVTNSSLVRNLERMAVIGATGVLISPAGAVILLWALWRVGLYDKMFKEKEFNKGEREALKRGLTVYKEVDGRGKYYFFDMGKLCSLNARDVRIPRMVKGISLSEVERDKLRKGELVMLKDKKGNELGIRVDVTRRNGIQEYYKEGRNIKMVPAPNSPDLEKLEYVSRKGFVGIKDIYGEKTVNLERDTFLSRYGLKSAFTNVREINIRNGEGNGLSAEATKMDNTLRMTAEQELNKLATNKSVKR